MNRINEENNEQRIGLVKESKQGAETQKLLIDQLARLRAMLTKLQQAEEQTAEITN